LPTRDASELLQAVESSLKREPGSVRLAGLGPCLKTRDEDTRQEFWLGAVRRFQRGGTVVQAVDHGQVACRRRRDREAVRAYMVRCHSCGLLSAPVRRLEVLRCRSCDSDKVDLSYRAVPLDLNAASPERPALDVIQAKRVETMRALLKGRERLVFDSITGRSIAPCVRCPKDCKGGIPEGRCDDYLRRIADAVKITPECVNVYRLRAVRKCQEFLLDQKRA
jgi:hypothetical protein